jgi:Ser/Thr protein kinase RdoA (MazF antagonist)
VGGRRATGRALALNSLENRVYDVELEDETRVVAKFYRPGRWSREAILDEHTFLAELAAEELPVVAPIDLGGGATLGATAEGILYAVFPRVRGRAPEELDDAQLLQLGRLVARLHHVGGRHAAPHRPSLDPASYGDASVRLLTESDWIPFDLLPRYTALTAQVLDLVKESWSRRPFSPIRLHGDCHLGNLLWANAPLFVDFDDFLHGPPVQDLWLLSPGHDPEAVRQRSAVVAGYRSMRDFDETTLDLVEPLRALRILRYTAWIAHRYRDPAFQRAFPDFEERSYWLREIAALDEQVRRLGRG